jgi:hypothetical protein
MLGNTTRREDGQTPSGATEGERDTHNHYEATHDFLASQ